MKKMKWQQSVFRDRSGGLSLEAAIILPLVIVVIIFLIQVILLIKVEIIMSTALDNTANEIALLIPIIEMATDESDFKKSIFDLEKGWLSNLDIGPMLEDAALDFASSMLFGRFIDERFAFWLQEIASNQLVSIHLISSTKMRLELQLNNNYLLLCQNVEMKTIFGKIDRTIISAVPVWVGSNENYDKNSKDEKSEKDGIWELDNFSRGKKLREVFGANLPFNYPVIAQFKNGNAVSITSIDLTAPTYVSQENIKSKIKNKLIALAEFKYYQSSSSDYPDILPDDIKTRKLVLIIPENSPEAFNQSTRQDLYKTAQNLNVEIEIMQYGNSKRFEDVLTLNSNEF